MSPNMPCGKLPYARKFELPKLANRILNETPHFQTTSASDDSVSLAFPGMKGKVGTSVDGSVNLSLLSLFS